MKKKSILFILTIILLFSIVVKNSENFTIPLKSDPYSHNNEVLIKNIYDNRTNNEILRTFKQKGSSDSLNSMCIPCDTECKPECCASLYKNKYPIYSCSTGCVCLNDKQYNYLLERGGNNIEGKYSSIIKQGTPINNIPNQNSLYPQSKIETQFALS